MSVFLRRRLSPLLLTVCLSAAAIAARPAQAQTPPEPPPPPATTLPLRLALQTEAAFGVITGSFHNQLLGARLDLGFSRRVHFGGYVGYAHLKGKDGPAHSALTYAQLEYLAGDLDARVRYPIRFASGYLGGNGPVVRLTAGLAIALTPRLDLITELLAPTLWVTNNQLLLSLSLSLELALRF